MLNTERLVNLLPEKMRYQVGSYFDALELFLEIRDPRVLRALGPAGVRELHDVVVAVRHQRPPGPRQGDRLVLAAAEMAIPGLFLIWLAGALIIRHRQRRRSGRPSSMSWSSWLSCRSRAAGIQGCRTTRPATRPCARSASAWKWSTNGFALIFNSTFGPAMPFSCVPH